MAGPTPQSGPQPAAPPAAPPDDKAKLDAILTKLEQDRGRPAIVYWTTPIARISLAAELPIFDQLRACGKRPAIDLVLFTNGGDTEMPWRIVSLIREFADTFSVLVPHRALSSGTLISLGADEIVMTAMSVLGPIDPSRTHPLLPRSEGATQAEPISVQDMRHAMQFIREAAPKDPNFAYTPEAMAQIFSALFAKIHPLAIGAIEQSYALAKLIGKQCLSTHVKGADAEKRIESIVNKLCDDYKSHLYQIGRKEAKDLGLDVVSANDATETVLLELLAFYSARPVGPFGGQVKPGQQVKTQIAWIDSVRQKFRCEQTCFVNQKSEIEVRGDGWVPY